MDYFFYIYTILIAILYAMNCMNFFALSFRKNSRLFMWIAVMFFAFIVDAVLLLAADLFLPLREFLVLNQYGLLLNSLLKLFLVFTYRKITIHIFNKKTTRTEYAVWAAVVLFFCFLRLGPPAISQVITPRTCTSIITYFVWIQSLVWLVSKKADWSKKLYRFLFIIIIFSLVLKVYGTVINVSNIMANHPSLYRSTFGEIFGTGYIIFGLIFLYYNTKLENKSKEMGDSLKSDMLLIKAANKYALTKRESEILGLLSEGLTNQEIGERLFISYGTVKQHVHKIFKKLSINNRQGIHEKLSEIQRDFADEALTHTPKS